MAFQAFLNECSLHGQFYDLVSFQTAFNSFVELVNRTRKAAEKGRGQLLRSQQLGLQKALKDMPLAQALNNMPTQDMRDYFADVVFNRTNPLPWEDTQKHYSSLNYSCTDLDLPSTFQRVVVGTSMAELAERRRQDDRLQGFLLNLEASGLSGRSDVTVTVQTSTVLLRCYEHCEALELWLEQQERVPVYTADSTLRVQDAQTCLVDSDRFTPTSLMNRKRHVFQERSTGHLYAVDNQHIGQAAELEVFDKRKNHIGTADIYQGKLNRAGKVEGRRLQNED